jgi:4'-phosphopantetheinyl transferase
MQKLIDPQNAVLPARQTLARGDVYVACVERRHRSALTKILASWFDIERSAFKISLNVHGKPECEHGFFSLSHSREVLCIAASRINAVGVDIEHRSELSAKVRDRCLLPSEQAQSPQAQMQIWCAKEAIVKALGRGIAFGLRRIEIKLAERKEICIDEQTASCWQLHTGCTHGLHFALAVAGSAPTAVNFSWAA